MPLMPWMLAKKNHAADRGRFQMEVLQPEIQDGRKAEFRERGSGFGKGIGKSLVFVG